MKKASNEMETREDAKAEAEAEGRPGMLRDWEQVPHNSLFQSHTRWEVLDTQHYTNNDDDDGDDDFSVFPPSNHENLHISLQSQYLRQQRQQQRQDHGGDEEKDEEEEGQDENQPSSPFHIDSTRALPPLFNSRLQILGVMLITRLRLGFMSLGSKFVYVGSLVRSWRGPNWALGASTAVAAALLASLWYLRRQRWRRRLRQEKGDRLILLLREQNEKISQLLDQVTRLNEILSTQRSVPVLRSS